MQRVPLDITRDSVLRLKRFEIGNRSPLYVCSRNRAIIAGPVFPSRFYTFVWTAHRCNGKTYDIALQRCAQSVWLAPDPASDCADWQSTTTPHPAANGLGQESRKGAHSFPSSKPQEQYLLSTWRPQFSRPHPFVGVWSKPTPCKMQQKIKDSEFVTPDENMIAVCSRAPAFSGGTRQGPRTRHSLGPPGRPRAGTQITAEA